MWYVKVRISILFLISWKIAMVCLQLSQMEIRTASASPAFVHPWKKINKHLIWQLSFFPYKLERTSTSSSDSWAENSAFS
jgi:hypothetical protein